MKGLLGFSEGVLTMAHIMNRDPPKMPRSRTWHFLPKSTLDQTGSRLGVAFADESRNMTVLAVPPPAEMVWGLALHSLHLEL